MQKETEKNLTPKQRRAIQAILLTGNVKQAAEAADVNRQTFYRWRKLPHFQRALKEAEAAALADLSRRLVGLSDKAAKALEAALDAPELRYRLRASEIVLGRLLQLRELVNLEERLEALETTLEEKEQ